MPLSDPQIAQVIDRFVVDIVDLVRQRAEEAVQRIAFKRPAQKARVPSAAPRSRTAKTGKAPKQAAKPGKRRRSAQQALIPSSDASASKPRRGGRKKVRKANAAETDLKSDVEQLTLF